MTESPPITLRYFDCRGRAQALRYYLRCRNIAFIDARISMKEGFAAWQAVKQDQRLTGPFLKLPVMHWGELQLAESPVIHDWLHRKLGDAALLTEQENLQHAMLSSSCRSELMTPLAMLLWQEAMYPGIDVAATVPGILKRINDHLQTLEHALAQWQWFHKLPQRPVMLADCLLWEELDKVHTIFGEYAEWQALPLLREFLHNGKGSEVFRRTLSEHPCQMTGRPQETEALARIHTALQTSK
jgi:hypothetical protein